MLFGYGVELSGFCRLGFDLPVGGSQGGVRAIARLVLPPEPLFAYFLVVQKVWATPRPEWRPLRRQPRS